MHRTRECGSVFTRSLKDEQYLASPIGVGEFGVFIFRGTVFAHAGFVGQFGLEFSEVSRPLRFGGGEGGQLGAAWSGRLFGVISDQRPFRGVDGEWQEVGERQLGGVDHDELIETLGLAGEQCRPQCGEAVESVERPERQVR